MNAGSERFHRLIRYGPAVPLAMVVGGFIRIVHGYFRFRAPGARRGPARRLGPVLMSLGAIGLFTLPLRPFLFALALLPLAFGTTVLALFGALWILLGLSLRNETVKTPERRKDGSLSPAKRTCPGLCPFLGSYVRGEAR